MTERPPELMPENDVIDLLLHQHAVIRDLFLEVESAEGTPRREALERLVRLLALHETAEEEIVHPMSRQVIPAGDAVVEERLQEEREAKEMLVQLDEMDADAPDFLPMLAKLREAVLAHARAAKSATNSTGCGNEAAARSCSAWRPR